MRGLSGIAALVGAAFGAKFDSIPLGEMPVVRKGKGPRGPTRDEFSRRRKIRRQMQRESRRRNRNA